MTNILFNSKLGLALILLALLAFLMAVMAPGLADAPFSQHAWEGHRGEEWNARTIQTAMTGGNCGPVTVYACQDGSFKYVCYSPTTSNRMLGLVVAQDDSTVITGYEGTQTHWRNKTKGCTRVDSGLTP